jgi:hypothetical protein
MTLCVSYDFTFNLNGLSSRTLKNSFIGRINAAPSEYRFTTKTIGVTISFRLPCYELDVHSHQILKVDHPDNLDGRRSVMVSIVVIYRLINLQKILVGSWPRTR